MIIKSEGEKIKLCQNPPRDRKYVIKAYTDLVVQYAQQFQEESLSKVISCLIQMCTDGFRGAQSPDYNTGTTEDMLIDGAVDQTY